MKNYETALHDAEWLLGQGLEGTAISDVYSLINDARAYLKGSLPLATLQNTARSIPLKGEWVVRDTGVLIRARLIVTILAEGKDSTRLQEISSEADRVEGELEKKTPKN